MICEDDADGGESELSMERADNSILWFMVLGTGYPVNPDTSGHDGVSLVQGKTPGYIQVSLGKLGNTRVATNLEIDPAVAIDGMIF